MYLYILTLVAATLFSLFMTPLVRFIAIKMDILDHPSTSVKTHTEPVPYLGGVAIFISFLVSLFLVRYLTAFPSGTLRSLRGILLGGVLIFSMGLADDVKKGGLHYSTKFMIQILAAVMLIRFGVRLQFIDPPWLAYAFTIIWIVGITNAFNIIDIMDGLSSGVGIIASFAFLFISLPTEEIYVNFAAVALAGAALGFIPYNLSKRFRIFMGDCGSLFLGFLLGALSMGTSYGKENSWGVFAPILILGVPIFDTSLVFFLRIKRGISPFLGSKDHFPLRMEKLGWKRPHILLFCWAFALFFSLGAYILPTCTLVVAISLGIFYAVILGCFIQYLLKVKVT